MSFSTATPAYNTWLQHLDRKVEFKLFTAQVNRLAAYNRPVERETIRKIREAVRAGKLPHEFTPEQVNNILRIHWAGTFLPKHRVGNPGGFTELFIRVGRGLYRLK